MDFSNINFVVPNISNPYIMMDIHTYNLLMIMLNMLNYLNMDLNHMVIMVHHNLYL